MTNYFEIMNVARNEVYGLKNVKGTGVKKFVSELMKNLEGYNSIIIEDNMYFFKDGFYKTYITLPQNKNVNEDYKLNHYIYGEYSYLNAVKGNSVERDEEFYNELKLKIFKTLTGLSK